MCLSVCDEFVLVRVCLVRVRLSERKKLILTDMDQDRYADGIINTPVGLKGLKHKSA